MFVLASGTTLHPYVGYVFLDSALTQWRRETIGQAIADLEAFVSQSQ